MVYPMGRKNHSKIISQLPRIARTDMYPKSEKYLPGATTGMRSGNGGVSTWQGAAFTRVRVDCAAGDCQSVLLDRTSQGDCEKHN